VNRNITTLRSERAASASISIHHRSLMIELAAMRRGGVINEGLRETVSDAVQLLAGSAAEYGITIVSAGAGIPGGVAAETVVDALFGAETVMQAVNIVSTAKEAAGKFQVIMRDAINATPLVKTDLKKFYLAVKSIIQRTFEILGSRAQMKARELAEEFKQWITSIIEKIADAVSDAVKFIVPDQMAGFAIGEGVQIAIESLTTNCYDSLVAIVKKLGKLSEYLTDPEKFPRFLEETIPNLVDLCHLVADDLQGGKYDKKLMGAAAAGLFTSTATLGVIGPQAVLGAPIIRMFGPTGLRKFAGTLEEKGPMLVSVAKKVLTVVIPAVFALVAMMQVIMRDEFVTKGEMSKLQDYEKNFRSAGALSAIASDYRNSLGGQVEESSDRALRVVVREEIARQRKRKRK